MCIHIHIYIQMELFFYEILFLFLTFIVYQIFVITSINKIVCQYLLWPLCYHPEIKEQEICMNE